MARGVSVEPASSPPPIPVHEVVIILIFIVFSTVLWWGKTASLWGDTSRWLFEAYRVSLGQVPYRDFSWPYPPLSILLVGAVFKLFGATIAQMFVAVFSAGIVILTWLLSRRLISPFVGRNYYICLLGNQLQRRNRIIHIKSLFTRVPDRGRFDTADAYPRD
jgi:hypothetical protein